MATPLHEGFMKHPGGVQTQRAAVQCSATQQQLSKALLLQAAPFRIQGP